MYRLCRLSPVPLSPVPLSPVPLSPGLLSPVPLSPVSLSPVSLSPVSLSPVSLSPVSLSPVSLSPLRARAALPPGPRRARSKDAAEPLKKAATDPCAENKKLNKSQQLKQVFKEYGAVGVSFHVGISLVSLGLFYLAVSSGVDMNPVLLKLGFSEASLQSRMAAGTSTFVLAYAVHKLFAPVRISITVVSVPFLVRYCRRAGFFKPPAPGP